MFRRFRIVGLIASFLVVAAQASPVAAIPGPGTSSIFGTVTEDGSVAALAGIVVTAYTSGGSEAGSDTTDGAGVYSIDALVDDSYTVSFVDTTGDHAFEFHADQPSMVSGTAVVVSGASVQVDAALAPAGTISGTILDDPSSGPLDAARVVVFDDTCTEVEWFVAGGVVVDGAFDTGVDGAYSIGGLPVGTYFVSAKHVAYMFEFYDDQPDCVSADGVTVTAGTNTSGVDLSLAVPPGSITGTVIEDGTGDPLAGVFVSAHPPEGGIYVSYDFTDAAGIYELTAVPVGSYVVFFGAFDDVHPAEYWNDHPANVGLASVDLVDVFTGTETAGIDAGLQVGGSISGTVTDSSTGDPVEGVIVGAFAVWGGSGHGVATDALGQYTIAALWAGDYTVQFAASEYAEQWWDDLPTPGDTVTVVSGTDTPGIDAALLPWGSIAGTVTEEGTGTPLTDITVVATDGSSGVTVSTSTDGSGGYVLTDLALGTYTVRFSDNDRLHLSELWNDQVDGSPGDGVVVANGVETSGIDAAMTLGGTVSGTVTEEGTGAPIAGVTVTVWSETGDHLGSDSTDAFGDYAVTGLEAGGHTVEFDDDLGVHLSEFWDDQQSFDAADPVVVVVATETPGVDASLTVGGSVSGTVTEDGTGDPLADIQVFVIDADDDFVGQGQTDGSGAYTVLRLPSGTYRIGFYDGAGVHATEFWDDRPFRYDADGVVVVVGSETAGVDASLTFNGSISGTITDEASGDPLEFVYVSVFDAHGDRAGGASSDSSGFYTIEGLAPGSYALEFSDDQGRGYVTEFWDARASLDEAELVEVVAASDTPNIDASLAIGGSISGTVTEDGSGSPIEGVWVSAHDIHGHEVASGYSNSLGAYSVDGLAAGDYTVRFDGSYDDYAVEWWDDVATRAYATQIAVTLSVDVPGIDAILSSTSVPANDAFANARMLDGSPFSITQSTSGATLEASEPVPSCGFDVGGTVWFGFTPTTAVSVVIDTLGSYFDTVVGVWTGSSVDALTAVRCNDDGDVDLESHVEFDADAGTTYWIQVGGYNESKGDLVLSVSTSPSIQRVDGPNRYSTAAAISLSQFPIPDDVDTVFLAVGTDFPDAVAGAAAAGRLGVPLLLVERGAIPGATINELKRLVPHTIVVLGGSAAVRGGVVDQLRSLPWSPDVFRLAGPNRYATGVAISQYAFPGTATEVIVATGESYADALSSVPAAVALDAPVLLTPRDSLPGVIAAEIARLAPTRIVVVGGTSAVSPTVFAQLQAIQPNTVRIAGPNRYATAVAVSQDAFGTGTDRVYITTGLDFPDALAGAGAAGWLGAPMLMVPGNVLPSAVATEILRLDVSHIFVLGGTAAISPTVVAALGALIGL